MEIPMNKKILLLPCTIMLSALGSDNYLFDTLETIYNDSTKTENQANRADVASLITTALQKPNLFSAEQKAALDGYKIALTTPITPTTPTTPTTTPTTPSTSTLTTDADVITAINTAKATATYPERISALNNIIVATAGKIFADTTKINFSSVLYTTVYAVRPKTDVDALDKLTALYTSYLTSSLFLEANRAFVTSALAEIAKDKATALAAQLNTNTQAAIKTAMAQAKYTNKISGLTTIVNNAKGKTFNATTKNAFAAALKKLYDNRAAIKKENATLKTNFLALLNASKTTPLLTTGTSGQQATVKKWIPVVQKL
jgi:hypothetical protein